MAIFKDKLDLSWDSLLSLADQEAKFIFEGTYFNHLYETRKAIERLEFLVDASLVINSSLDLSEILRSIVELSTRAVNAERGTLYLVDKEQGQVWSEVLLGDETLEIRMPLGKGIAGHVALSGEELIIDDVQADKRHNGEFDAISGFKTRNMLCLPVRDSQERIIGVLQLMNKRDRNFNEDDLELAKALAAQAAVAIKNARLTESIIQAHRDTIFRLSVAAEFRDPETARHLKRISYFSAAIARELGWDDDQVNLIRLASPMHDIGKIGIPDSILLKPGRLTPEERKVMQEHTVIGGDILRDPTTELLSLSRDIALYHHEKYDGSGYPFGYGGSEIPLAARIVALADVFDAVSTRRCYKPAYPQEEVLKIIEGERGKHFDPDCVDVFLSSYRSIKEYLAANAG